MDRLSVSEAKARFSEVLSRAERGKETVLTKRGVVVARVVPAKPARSGRWDHSEAVDRIVEFSKSCRARGKVDLQRLIEEGRLNCR